jgi:hypothetical protein
VRANQPYKITATTQIQRREAAILSVKLTSALPCQAQSTHLTLLYCALLLGRVSAGPISIGPIYILRDKICSNVGGGDLYIPAGDIGLVKDETTGKRYDELIGQPVRAQVNGIIC